MARIELLEQLLQEGANIDNQVIGMLARAGIGAPGKEGREARDNILTALKSIRVGNDRNAPYLYYWDVNPNVKGTGKTILPIVQYMIDAYKAEGDGAQIPAILNRIGDAVRLKHSLKTTVSKSWEGLKKNKDTDTLEKLESWLRNESGRAENKIKVHTSEFDFPELEVYSDENVDCYKADNPAEAMELGDKYTFCISYKGGGNQFYTYRFGTHPSWHAKQKTSCYFCWFKDAEGNKNHSDMIVLHVGEDGDYMATESQNGIFPWLSKSELLEKYPVLRPALPYMPYKEPTKEEEISRYFDEDVNVTYEPIPEGTDLSRVMRYNLAKYDPKYLGMIISTGVHLDNKAFEYEFKTIDNSDLVRGNQGDSITKKYIEIGYHPLTDEQEAMLREVGYGKEVDRAKEIRIRRKISQKSELSSDELLFILKRSSKEELSRSGNPVRDYILSGYSWARLNDEAEDYLLQLGLPELAYCYWIDTINRGVDYFYTWDDKTFKIAFEFVDKGDIKKKDSVVRRYLEDTSHKSLTSEMRKLLVDNGYSEEVEKYDKEKESADWERWKNKYGNLIDVTETSKGYILFYTKDYYGYRGYDIPNPPNKPVIEIFVDESWRVELYFSSENAKYRTKKLPIIKDLKGKVLEGYNLVLINAPRFTEFEVSWDKIRLLNVQSKIPDLRGLTEVPKGKTLELRCSKASLEGLKGSDFNLYIYNLRSFKGMAKKLDNLTLNMSKPEFDKLEDKSMPDEVGEMEIRREWKGDIEVLPKKIGVLKMSNSNDKITAKGVESLGVLPNITAIPTKNVKWYASKATEENVKKASETYSYDEDEPVFYGANSAKPIPETVESPNFWHSWMEVYVYPFVSSLRGLICPKATDLRRSYTRYGTLSDEEKIPINSYILYVYQN